MGAKEIVPGRLIPSATERYAPHGMNEVSLVYPSAHRAVITIERARTLNSLDLATLAALREAAGEVANRRELKVVVVRGRGRAFSSGVDLSLLGAGDETDPRVVAAAGLAMSQGFDSVPPGPRAAAGEPRTSRFRGLWLRLDSP